MTPLTSQYYVHPITNKLNPVSFEVFMVVPMKNAIFWDVMPCYTCKNTRFAYVTKVKRNSELGTLAVTRNSLVLIQEPVGVIYLKTAFFKLNHLICYDFLTNIKTVLQS
jgi:hypothetical protein